MRWLLPLTLLFVLLSPASMLYAAGGIISIALLRRSKR